VDAITTTSTIVAGTSTSARSDDSRQAVLRARQGASCAYRIHCKSERNVTSARSLAFDRSRKEGMGAVVLRIARSIPRGASHRADMGIHVIVIAVATSLPQRARSQHHEHDLRGHRHHGDHQYRHHRDPAYASEIDVMASSNLELGRSIYAAWRRGAIKTVRTSPPGPHAR